MGLGYITCHFFAKITTTQRCESLNASLAIYLKYRRTYLDFVHAIEQGHSQMRLNESRVDYASM